MTQPAGRLPREPRHSLNSRRIPRSDGIFADHKLDKGPHDVRGTHRQVSPGGDDIVADVSAVAFGRDRGRGFFTTEVWTWRGLVTLSLPERSNSANQDNL